MELLLVLETDGAGDGGDDAGGRPMSDRGSITQSHFDHVHLSVRS